MLSTDPERWSRGGRERSRSSNRQPIHSDAVEAGSGPRCWIPARSFVHAPECSLEHHRFWGSEKWGQRVAPNSIKTINEGCRIKKYFSWLLSRNGRERTARLTTHGAEMDLATVASWLLSRNESERTARLTKHGAEVALATVASWLLSRHGRERTANLMKHGAEMDLATVACWLLSRDGR